MKKIFSVAVAATLSCAINVFASNTNAQETLDVVKKGDGVVMYLDTSSVGTGGVGYSYTVLIRYTSRNTGGVGRIAYGVYQVTTSCDNNCRMRLRTRSHSIYTMSLDKRVLINYL